MSWTCALAAVSGIGLLYLASMLHATGGRASLPLDDSFIYFQYAARAAEGHLFVYHAGDAATTGATSLPWMLLLSLTALLGFEGKSLIFPAMILGGVLLAGVVRATAGCAREIHASDGTDPPGAILGIPFAALLVLLSGPLQWAAWSGMEIAYVCLAMAGTLHATARAGGAADGRTALWAGMLATSRPEGAALAGLVAAMWVVRAVLHPGERGTLGWALLPLGLAFAQPLANVAFTGDPRSAGLVAKTALFLPGADLLTEMRAAMLRAATLLARILSGAGPPSDGAGLYAYGSETAALWLAPGAGLLVALGLLPHAAREWAERRPGAGLLSAAWIPSLLLATCLLEEPDAHYGRYQMPLLPVLLVWAAVGAGSLHGGLARLGSGIRGWLLLSGAASVLFFAVAFGDNSGDIDRMQIRLGEALGRRLPPDAVVAVNDAGAIPYFSGLRTVDLVGLTTPGFAGLRMQGAGALWEKLESLPPAERPGWFCYFPNWFDLERAGFLDRVGSVRLLAPSIVDAEKVLAACDWTLAGSGHAPRSVAAVVVDRIDVADRVSEKEHAFSWRSPERGADAPTFLRRAEVRGSAGEILDGGRTVFGEIRFRMGRDSEAPVTLIARTATGARQRVSVSVDGGKFHEVEIYEPGSGAFHEQAIAVLGPGPDPARVRVRILDEPASGAPLILAHLFAVAEG